MFSVVTAKAYPLNLATQFLQHLAEELYLADPTELGRDPQNIDIIDSALKFNI